ncbi:MAG TPA: tail fiber protein [Baekduia sp.]
MSDPFVAEIRVVGFTFAPTGWATCDGQLLPLSQNTALFSLLGTMYGGDGRSTFALPNLAGQTVVGVGEPAASGSYYDQGQAGGSETVALVESQIQQHTHSVQADGTDVANQTAATPGRALARSRPGRRYQTTTTTNLVATAPDSAQPQGSGLAHNNLPPMLVLNYIIALQGTYPPRQ